MKVFPTHKKYQPHPINKLPPNKSLSKYNPQLCLPASAALPSSAIHHTRVHGGTFSPTLSRCFTLDGRAMRPRISIRADADAPRSDRLGIHEPLALLRPWHRSLASRASQTIQLSVAHAEAGAAAARLIAERKGSRADPDPAALAGAGSGALRCANSEIHAGLEFML